MFGRVLDLELKKDSGVFTNDHEKELGNGSEIDPDLSFLYSGGVKGMPDSHCHGSLIEGIFQGTIYLPTETYYVEKSTRFFDEDPGFHSVIYRERDIRCADVPKRRSMESIANLYDVLTDKRNTLQAKGNSNGRHKRAVHNLGPNNTCALYLLSDPMFWNHYLNKSGGDPVLARREILWSFASHVQAVNHILANTSFQTFNGTLGYLGLQLAIAKTRIMTHDDCQEPSPSPYCTPDLDVNNILNILSQENHDLFCLAYAFTYRDFSEGVLGKAWIAYPGTSGGSGGICEKYKPYVENGNGVLKSYNTGTITTLNYGEELFPTVSHLNFAHQIGHSLGAQHDTDSTCAPYTTSCPYSDPGNFIMFEGMISGNCENNKKFSICSRDSIALVLDDLLHTPGKNCIIPHSPLCGNGIVEEGEQCDCGFTEHCEESCCIPRNPNGTSSDMCTLKVGMVCSPSAGPCCTDACQYVAEGEAEICFHGDCKIAHCSGSATSCPAASNKPNGTTCGTSGQVCQSGECIVS